MRLGVSRLGLDSQVRILFSEIGDLEIEIDYLKKHLWTIQQRCDHKFEITAEMHKPIGDVRFELTCTKCAHRKNANIHGTEIKKPLPGGLENYVEITKKDDIEIDPAIHIRQVQALIDVIQRYLDGHLEDCVCDVCEDALALLESLAEPKEQPTERA